MFAFDNGSESVDQFQDAHLKEHVKEMVVALEESENEIFVQVIIKGLLVDGSLDDVLGHILLGYFVRNPVLPAPEVHVQGDVILEHVMGSGEVVFVISDLFDFAAEIAGEIKGSQLKRLHKYFLI